ncbi:hypothetical protein JTE90_020018 [Oedothorax gibbosus]|uniref:Uncharacterized protein n=1 Tax=Oedothorax gibbosus TaxID=931172 RepID=A0AAV6UKP1_9ARAC|nr:hypothetical protein JTE90_020018 [Oedothorax gibbosus]
MNANLAPLLLLTTCLPQNPLSPSPPPLPEGPKFGQVVFSIVQPPQIFEINDKLSMTSFGNCTRFRLAGVVEGGGGLD